MRYSALAYRWSKAADPIHLALAAPLPLPFAEPKTGRWPPAKHPTLATSSGWKEDACHPKGELRSSWKSNCLGRLAEGLALNCRFSAETLCRVGSTVMMEARRR
jgi:hypothetical protein